MLSCLSLKIVIVLNLRSYSIECIVSFFKCEFYLWHECLFFTFESCFVLIHLVWASWLASCEYDSVYCSRYPLIVGSDQICSEMECTNYQSSLMCLYFCLRLNIHPRLCPVSLIQVFILTVFPGRVTPLHLYSIMLDPKR